MFIFFISLWNQAVLESKLKCKFLMIFGVFSCGKKSPIEKPDNYSSPDFSEISDEG
jgi:hypothetical protein